MDHIIKTILYGPYDIVHIIWPIWVTWWPNFKIYKTDQDEIKAVFDDCRQMGFEFRRPKDFLLPALLVIIDHNHDGDITNDELRSFIAHTLWPIIYGEFDQIKLEIQRSDVHVRFDRRERIYWHGVWSRPGIFGLYQLSGQQELNKCLDPWLSHRRTANVSWSKQRWNFVLQRTSFRPFEKISNRRTTQKYENFNDSL